MVSQLKLTDFWNEPPQRNKKEGQEETYNICFEEGYNCKNMTPLETGIDILGKEFIKAINRVATSESVSQIIELTKPIMSLQTTMAVMLMTVFMWSILSERLTRVETRLETLENEFRSFRRRVKADIRRRRTYLSAEFVSNVVSLLLKLLRVVKDWIHFIR